MANVSSSVVVAYNSTKQILWVGSRWGGCPDIPATRGYVPLVTLRVPKSDLAAYLGEELARTLLKSPPEIEPSQDGDELSYKIVLPDKGLAFPALNISFNCVDGLKEKYKKFSDVARNNIYAHRRIFTHDELRTISEALTLAQQLFAGWMKSNHRTPRRGVVGTTNSSRGENGARRKMDSQEVCN